MENALTFELELTKQYPYSYSIEFAGSPLEKIRARLAPNRFKLASRQIIKELAIKSNDKVLEIGSGLGLLGKEIKHAVGADLKYVGIDLVFNSLSKGEKSISPTQADAVTLPFTDNSFNKIVSTDVLEHIPNARIVAAEIYRVLKPEGMAFVVIADPSEGRFSKVSSHLKRSKEGTDISWWEKLFKDTGFDVLSEASEKYRKKDWRKIFNLPFLVRLKDKPGFACAFNPVYRPGTYILQKPVQEKTTPPQF